MNSIIHHHPRNTQFCNNCGKTGKQMKKSKKPSISSGIICFKIENNVLKYLVICRKDSLGFVDFLRGKYSLNNISHVKKLINEMTNREKHMLLTQTFDELWYYLWGNFVGNQYKNEEKHSREKFYKLKEGFVTEITLQTIIDESETSWETPEWGFPKGRRNNGENDISSAIREYVEETGHAKYSFTIIDNIIPYEEIFTGSNFKSYKHKYYLAYMKYNNINDKYFQKSEVSKMEWCPIDKAISRIRPYSLEKIKIIKKIDNILKKYNLINFK